MELVGWLVLFIVLGLITSKFVQKEQKTFDEEDFDIKHDSVITSDVDPITQVLVTFIFKQSKKQHLVQSQPNIVINKDEKHKMNQNILKLKLSPEFHLHFGIPDMGRESFKLNKDMHLEAGYHYRISFESKILVFQKPKIIITKVNSI